MADNEKMNLNTYKSFIFLFEIDHMEFFPFSCLMQENSNEKIYKFYTCQKLLHKKLIQIKFILYYVLGLKEVIRR